MIQKTMVFQWRLELEPPFIEGGMFVETHLLALFANDVYGYFQNILFPKKTNTKQL
jgi:hypothetical protein